MAQNGKHSKLTDSPTNLKEAIDWILRVTNKDGQDTSIDAQHCLCPLSQAVVTVLRDVQVKEYIGSRNRDSTVNGDLDEEWDLVSGILSSIETIGGVRTTRNLIEEVAESLRKFVGWKETYDESSSVEDDVEKKIVMGNEGIGCPGKNGGSSGNSGNEKYTSAYSEEATISTINSDGTVTEWTILAKILLGAIPLVFSGMSYLYWMAFARNGFQSVSGTEGGSKDNKKDIPLYYYMERMGYDMSQVTVKSGYQVDLNGIIEVFGTCGIFGVNMVDDERLNYAEYLEKLREDVRQKMESESDPGRKDFEGNGDFPVQMDDATDTKDHALLKLNTLCTGYFRALNQPYRVHRRNHRLPRTIREILYWLSCVQYCPVFRVLVQKMQQLCRRNGEGPNGEITFYGSNYKGEQTTCKIDSSNCITYFLSAALVAPMVLLSIQDTIESKVPEVVVQQAEDSEGSVDVTEGSGETGSPKASHEMTYEEKLENILEAGGNQVFIHDLYSNSLFEFRFPMSEMESYYLLQDCLFGLFYQLYFLMKQCYWDRKSGYGWGWCKYGDKVVCEDEGKDGTGCLSWICPVGDKKKHGFDTGKNGEDNQCGSSTGKASPLQAFLCDCLKGFTCEEVVKKQSLLSQMATEKDMKNYTECYPEFLEHRGHTSKIFGTECAVPMGFSGSFRSGSTTASGSSSGMIGLGICGVLYNFTIDDISSSSLYQLTRCICSLTRRVPRSVGTIYGFFYGLGGMLYKGDGVKGQRTNVDAKKFLDTLKGELRSCPGYRNPECLMIAVYDWRGQTHVQGTDGKNNGFHEKGTLDSLNACKTDKVTCGWYLQPLSGCMYNSVATVYCDTYLSWILYLSGRLQDGLKALRDAFLGISCEDCKCKNASQCKSGECKKGTHGKSDSTSSTKGCCCNSVVDCVGVHGLFYRFGFTYNSPGYLAHDGKDVDNKNYKRTCQQFYQRLEKVINGTYYKELSDQIRKFMYTTRLPFSLVIFSFWLAVIVYLLWSMTVNLDLVHIQSHWKPAQSHLVPLQRILADGSRKGFCTLGYFQDSGDSLLSLGAINKCSCANSWRSSTTNNKLTQLEVSIQAAAGNKEVQLHQQLWYIVSICLVASIALLSIQDTIESLVPEVGGQQAEDTEGSVDCLCPLSQAVVTVLRDVQVKEYIGNRSRDRDITLNGALDSSDEEWNLVQEILSKIDTIGGVRTTRKLIQDVASKLAEFIGWKEGASGGSNGTPQLDGNGIGCPGNKNGCSHNNGGGGSKCEGYQSSYNGETATISALITAGSTTAGAGSDSGKDSWTILAKIFLGAIPLVFSGLSYMYWLCSGSGAGREGFKKGDQVNNNDQVICHYLKRCGFDTGKLRTNGDAKGIKVEDLKKAISSSGILDPAEESKLSDSFAMYLEAVRSKVSPTPPTTGGKTTEHALLKLNTLCTGYFRALNQPYRVHRRQHRLPRTIREILYWLSCVQYCPVFRVLVQKMQQLCQRVGGDTGITFYGSDWEGKPRECSITVDNCVSYFLSAALVAPMVLLSIQDTIESVVGHLVRESGKEIAEKPTHEMTYQEKIDRLADNSKPVPIHDLYANTLFEFRFPMSETESYYLLQDCLVALYYQLYFLKQQCNFHRLPQGQQTGGGSPMDGFDWTRCRYGAEVKCDNISGWKCTENKGENKEQNQCGQSGTPSPLQAFLCDCLPGFTCKTVEDRMKTYCGKDKTLNTQSVYRSCYMEFVDHRGHCPPGQYCPIPMGFSGSFKGAPAPGVGGAAGNGIGMSGLGINGIVMYYANDDLRDSCLYQLVRCICSLTRRVPRSTGTLYGFFYGLGGILLENNVSGQGQKNANVMEFKDAFTKELSNGTPSVGGDSGELIKVVGTWRGSKNDHKKDAGKCSSLSSLSDCKGAGQSGQTCGKYLHPLTGSLYNSVATQYCDTYLSWILYLAGVLKTGLESLLVEFRNINCKDAGCRKFDSSKGGFQEGECECKDCTGSKHGRTGIHGEGNQCCCTSVVHCAGVYSVFYRFGFSYVSPFGLSGRETGSSNYNSDTRRQCHHFYKQLQIVIKGKPFADLLKQIRGFLYTTRLPFTLVIFSFWSIVIGYLLWSMTVNLDLIHIQSHWRSPGTYLVPLQRILADGSRNVKGVCTIGYFQENNGDRLLSQGVSDVYL